MDLVSYLQATPSVFVAVAALLGLIVGSFLNVVIHRVPIMMETDWRRQCLELNGAATKEEEPSEAFNLLRPGSRCPHCGHAIRPWENIPLVSYLLLRGKCSECGADISPRYPAIELLAALLSAGVAWHFGFGLQALAALILTWGLIALSGIDLDHQILPDAITLPLLWLGLIASLAPVFVDPGTSIIGAVTGYLSLWLVFHLFRLITGKEGMGYGDFKLLAALGAWMGWQALPIVIVLSSLVGAVAGLALIAFKGRDRNIPIPFGPYLAAAGWLSLLWRHEFIAYYLRWAGLS